MVRGGGVVSVSGINPGRMRGGTRVRWAASRAQARPEQGREAGALVTDGTGDRGQVSLVPACLRSAGRHIYHGALCAIRSGSGGIPLLFGFFWLSWD